MFVKHNMAQWQAPLDMVFEPSPVWLDDSRMAVDETAKIYLRNILGKSKGQARELKQEIDKKVRDVESVRRMRQKVREGKEKKDEVELVRGLFSMQDELHQVERQRLTADIETLTIMAVAGDLSLGAQNHSFKSETFKIPTNCDLCGDRIWGLSAKGFDCQLCGYTCHKQCELKVPATCPGEQSKEERKKLKAERQATSKKVVAIPDAGRPDHIAELPDLSRSNTMDTLSSGYAASANRSVSARQDNEATDSTLEPEPAKPKPSVGTRRNRVLAPPPSQYKSEAANGTSGSTPTSVPTEPKGKMLYAFQSSNDGELSVPEDENVVVAEADDGSGWTSVRYGGETGLVPTSYLELLPEPPPKPFSPTDRPISSYSSSSASLTGNTQSAVLSSASATSLSLGKKKGPAVAPKRGAKKLKYVEAMYDYQARSDAEWSMTEGEKYVCVNRDTGDGWADVERGGVIKSVPANYIQDV